jgi:hypothetical protein
MSKKKRKPKSKRPTLSRKKNQEVKIEEDLKAIKTMVIGAVCVAIFIAFFVFKVDGQSLYDRLVQDNPSQPAASAPKKN